MGSLDVEAAMRSPAERQRSVRRWFGSSFLRFTVISLQFSTDADDDGGEAYMCTRLSRPDPQVRQFRPTFSRRPDRRINAPAPVPIPNVSLSRCFRQKLRPRGRP